MPRSFRALRAKSGLLAAVGALVLGSSATLANYNSNLAGTVVLIATYYDGTVLFRLANQPSANGACDASFFEVDAANTSGDAAINRMYARLAQAYAMGEAVNVGFDNSGGCGGYGYIRVYRIG